MTSPLSEGEGIGVYPLPRNSPMSDVPTKMIAVNKEYIVSTFGPHFFSKTSFAGFLLLNAQMKSTIKPVISKHRAVMMDITKGIGRSRKNVWDPEERSGKRRKKTTQKLMRPTTSSEVEIEISQMIIALGRLDGDIGSAAINIPYKRVVWKPRSG